MASTLIVGDGPAGLSAALFLAKRGHQVTVFGEDQTPMHHAELHNYLGLPVIAGSDFQTVAREQVRAHGADLRDEAVTGVEVDGERVRVRTDGDAVEGDYLVLAGGKPAQRLARELGVRIEDGRVAVDAEYRTDHDRVYALGRMVRPERSQAIISAGTGAVAALDILSREEGGDVHDWDTPSEHDHDHPGL